VSESYRPVFCFQNSVKTSSPFYQNWTGEVEMFDFDLVQKSIKILVKQ